MGQVLIFAIPAARTDKPNSVLLWVKQESLTLASLNFRFWPVPARETRPEHALSVSSSLNF
jgi:hypothetical protein